jgi:hypothetical protein
MKIVAFDDIYNFIVQTFHLKSFSSSNNQHKYFFFWQHIKKQISFVFMDGDKSYTKIVAFIESYNFVVHAFVIWNYFDAQINDII